MISRDADGKLPAYAWPGGYPIIYIVADGGVLCPACANGDNGSEAAEAAEAPAGWRLVGADVHYEGAPAVCDHCGTAIASAYGEPAPC